MIDINREELLTMAEASEALPSRPTRETLWRWRTFGIHGVKLSTVLICAKRYTSREEIQRFVQASTRAADARPKRRQLAATA
jgi:hypothetical protein